MDPEEQKEGYFEHFTNNSITTPPDQEDMAATDGISKFVERVMDGLAGEAEDSGTERPRSS
ncbi:hypothetical protein [Paenibacillus ehimensis]|uniref:Uncharacterized protein n=1 Tax=Paenibacillus ehimensis TaxID=79264 RepID=A0ABT8VJE7_9BACL|nr:hypothetical protein [Paenibacillus ehimensis]MDO3681103.1 hypothetical protein [Paenibacillus ehimensis]MEC0210928.1 hypothetical protein [Paenibacillus ehimensis]